MSIYFYLNQQKAFELLFKFNEDYVKTQDGDVTIYKAQDVLYNSEAVLEKIQPTRRFNSQSNNACGSALEDCL
ncbi:MULTISPECIES: hypothetical protein [unclassified Lysinibacillus]|uniref:hypothetical protein n=1 Tax=unclassified Lysinibacillus TaxID=2636778 RepID=UPI00131EF166|nr:MULTISPECIES: hypothetical protein [unclassified Lysinibacillus]